MKPEEIEVLINYRLEQAEAALDDAKYLLEGQRSPQGIINRSYYAMFYAAIALLQKIGKIPSKHAGVISLFDTDLSERTLKGLPQGFRTSAGIGLQDDKTTAERSGRTSMEQGG
jgi:hypothetical protein